MEEREPRDDGFREECGVVGILGRGNVVDLLYYGLYALQHRGQQGAGICVHNGEKTWVIKGLGLVHDALSDTKRASVNGYMGIAHNRYATTGRSTKIRNVQPLLVDYKGGKLAIAHNGNLTNVAAIRKSMEESGSIFQTTTDSEIVLHLIAKSKGATLPDRVKEAVSQLEGALTCLIMNEQMLLGYRDPSGVRPLSLGVVDGMHVLASESCAFDLLGAEFIRDVNPGELIVLTKEGASSMQLVPPKRDAQCMFELVYFSRPDSVVYGEPVNEARREMGRALARRHGVPADVVIAIPDSSNSAAQGYAEEAGLPYELGLIRNHYVGRTFIGPDQAARVDAVRVKFNPVRSILEGKRVIAVDDSIVRGTTSRKLVDLLYRAGAKEVHFRVSSPPVTHPCHYGVNTPSREELIASSSDVEAIRQYIGATTLGYLSMDDLEHCVKDKGRFCYACWTGDYPIPVPELANAVPFDVD
ncbi:MAG: amidophosphoribosyltransferase [Candidatus Eisenbacteria bacterium]